MKNELNREVNILILPPFFSKLNSGDDRFIFLSLKDMVKKDLIFEQQQFNYTKENEKRYILELFKKIEDSFFSSNDLEGIEEVLRSDKKIFFVNYPTNFKQFKNLNSILTEHEIKISKFIIANFETFENFEHLKSDYLICPFCFNSFKKKEFISNNNSLICPNNGEEITITLANSFSKLFNDRYLKSNLVFAQELSAAKNRNEINIEILPLIISESEKVEDLLT